MAEFTELLKCRAFRNIWGAGLLSAAGGEVSRVAIFLFLFGETSSILALAALAALRTAPAILVSPLSGSIIDRIDKRRGMVLCELARMSFIACILIRPTTMMVYAMTVFDSIAASLFEPLRKTSIPLVVGKMQIPAANGLENISSSSTMILGPVVGAELFVRSGLTIALAIDAISYLMSAWLINGARIPQTESSSEFAPTRLKEELINGWRYAVEHDFIARIATLLFVSIICGGLWFPLAPFFVRDVLETGPALVGWQISVFGLGGIAGGLLAPRLSKHFELLRILHWSCLLEAFAMIVYSLVRSPASSTLMIFFWGILVSVIGVCSHSILQARVNEQYLGKVFSFLKQAENSAMLLSMLAAVSLTSIISIPHLFFVSGLSYCVVVGISRSRRGAPASVA